VVDSSSRRYPYFLVTAQTAKHRTQAIALEPVELGVDHLKKVAAVRLRDFVFHVRDKQGTAEAVLKAVSAPYAAALLRSVRYYLVRLARDAGEADRTEVATDWYDDVQPSQEPMSPGWPLISPTMPITVWQRTEIDGTHLEVDVTAKVGEWGWSLGNTNTQK
jgi:hypothetical protein